MRRLPAAAAVLVVDSCGGVSQQPWDYTKVIARYRG